jgi:hypothetical protein
MEGTTLLARCRVAVATACCLLVAACGTPDRPAAMPTASPSSTPSSASPSTATSTGAAPAVYKATAAPCDAVDYDSLSAVLGPVSQAKSPRTTRGGVVTTAMCQPVFGKPGTRIPAIIEIQIVDDGGSTADFYAGMRGAQREPLTDIPGLGQAAYTYTDPATGPHLATYDGNLYLTIVVLTGASSAAPTAGIDQAIIASARNTMANLRQA